MAKRPATTSSLTAVPGEKMIGPRASNHLSGADGVRAIACLAVFTHHFFAFGFHAGSLAARSGHERPLLAGSNGVGAFFVLSGFLLSLPFWKAHRAGKPMPSMKVYTVRRLGRIVPGYVLCFVVTWLLAQQYNAPGGVFQLVTALTCTNTFFPNTYLPPFNMPLWSISIEMLFYVMLPLVALGMFRLPTAKAVRIYVLGVIVVIVALQFALQTAAPRIEATVGNPALFQADSRAVTLNALILFTQFLVGFFTADAYLSLQAQRGDHQSIGGERGGWNRFDTVAAAILVFVPVLLMGGDQLIPGFWRLWYPKIGSQEIGLYHWPVLTVMFGILLVALAFSSRIGRWLDTPFLRWTATLSFGIYMWHVPVLRGVAWLWPGEPGATWAGALAMGAVALAASYAVAAASYYAIESPVLKWAHKRG